MPLPLVGIAAGVAIRIAAKPAAQAVGKSVGVFAGRQAATRLDNQGARDGAAQIRQSRWTTQRRPT